MSDKPSKYIAICAEEFKETLKNELAEMGALDIEEGFKAVSFYADRKTSYKVHLKTATASRIMEVQREGAARDRKSIFFQALKIKWPELFKPGATYLVEGIAGDRGPKSPTSNDISKVIREAIESSFSYHKQPKPKVDLKNPVVVVVAFYYRKRICISLLTSGKSMHKRGYKSERHPAPVKEHVASSLLRMAGYDGSQTLYDPMCGSGTLSIEGAYIALRKGALIHRKKGDFGLEHLTNFDKDLWREAQEEVRKERIEEPTKPIYASDVEPKYIAMTKRHAMRARVERYIEMEQKNFFDSVAPDDEGILIVNLPYGERLEKEDIAAFYKEFGDKLKQSYKGWTCAVLAAEESPWKRIGLRAHRKYRVSNGGIECRFLLFHLYEGSKKGKYMKNHESQPDDFFGLSNQRDQEDVVILK